MGSVPTKDMQTPPPSEMTKILFAYVSDDFNRKKKLLKKKSKKTIWLKEKKIYHLKNLRNAVKWFS